MSQVRQNPLDEVRIPFAKMTFTPDVPSTALGPLEYNVGLNVETDVRGIRSVAGEQEFLDALDGTPTFITGGFRADTNFWFIVATTEGKWWATYNGTWQDITPAGGDFSNYAQNTNIMDSWNGTVPFFNDTWNPPMMWLEGDATLTIYKNLIPSGIDTIAYYSPTEQILTFTNVFNSTGSSISGTTLTIGTLLSGTPEVGQRVTISGGSGVAAGTYILGNIAGSGSGSTWQVNISQTVAASAIVGSPYGENPYAAGDRIVITGVNDSYNGTFEVVSSSQRQVIYLAVPTSGYPSPPPDDPIVSPLYSWNYNTDWVSYTASFMRMYSTPNVGSILVAGNLSAVNKFTTAVEEYPVTIQWSQAFGLNQAPLTWEPTVLNVANQVEVPLRGPTLDAFPSNGQFFLCSFWDTAVLSPLNYSTTSAPILGVRLYNQGRGLLSANCWANADKLVYGVDARDIWVFDGQDFTGLGNQRVKNWFYDQLDPAYYDRVFVEANTQKNQIEIYYPDSDATVTDPLSTVAITGTAGQFSCTAATLSVGQSIVVSGTLTGTGTITGYANPTTYYVKTTNGSTTFTLSATPGGTALVTTAGTTTGLSFVITYLGVPNKMLSYRYDIDCWNAPRDVSSATLACESPIYVETTPGTWTPNFGSRTLVYAQGLTDSKIVQKDIGYALANGDPITSRFRRDNIKMIKDYSGKLMVHRILPEAVNIGAVPFSSTDEIVITPSTGTISVTVEGANSVGQEPTTQLSHVMSLDTDNPWTQIDQNAYRVNSLELGNTSDENIWMCSAVTWQFTQVEDDR